MAKNRKILDETENVTSTKRGVRTKNHCIETYELTKKRLSYFYPLRIVESDGNGKNSLPLKV